MFDNIGMKANLMRKTAMFLGACIIFCSLSSCNFESENIENSGTSKTESLEESRDVENSDVSETVASEKLDDLNNHSTELEDENFDFRYGVWGESVEQIKRREDAEFIGENEGNLAYEGSLSGCECGIIYVFSDNKLVEGGYTISDVYTNPGQYISTYESIKQQLYEKYGDAVTDETIKMQTDSLIEAAGPASALKYGYVAYKACWETENTVITIAMMAENYDVFVVLQYKDKNFIADDGFTGL